MAAVQLNPILMPCQSFHTQLHDIYVHDLHSLIEITGERLSKIIKFDLKPFLSNVGK